MLISSEQDATGRSGFLITTVPNSTSTCMHEQGIETLTEFLTGSAQTVVETPAPIVSQD